MSIPEKIKELSETEKLIETLLPFALFWLALKNNIKTEAGDLYLLDAYKLCDQEMPVYGSDCEAAYEVIKDRITPYLEARGIDVV